ncbi:MAG: tetratricopeptide repeat protein [Proteobacteria bacterium]|nr:tetratricopeptide repeat protein [Pseudomonadota bacterium]MBI3498789.1 tetratricopeptide repeat protein [Pseudomonadota bacterium]
MNDEPQAVPRSAEASYEAGNASFAAGDLAAARSAYAAAVRRKPGFAEAHYNLGIVLHRLGDREGAARSFAAALTIRPHLALARLNLATLRHESGDLRSAIRLYRGVLAEEPQLSDALGNLGQALGRHTEAGAPALIWLARALAVSPLDASTLCNLGAMLDDNRAAQRRLRGSLALAPMLAAAQLNYGTRLREAAAWPAAQRCYRRALVLAHGAVALTNLALVALDLNDGVEAERRYRQALALEPALAGTHRGRAELEHRRGEIGRSWLRAARALAIDPDDGGAANNLANALLALGKAGTAVSYYRQALEADSSNQLYHNNLLFCLAYVPDSTIEDLYLEARRWEARHAASNYREILRHDNPRLLDRRLRVAYLSADFRDHPVAWNLLGLLENHDRPAIAAFGYAELRTTPDAMTERCRGLMEGWRDTAGLSDRAVAKQIRSDAIDILVTIAGHTGPNRLGVASFRPAPVQVSMYDITTSGLEVMDAWLTDSVLHPADTAEKATERLVRLARFCVHRPPEASPPLVPPPVCGRGYVTFGSCNNPAKLNEPVAAAWASILRQVPGSRLALKYKGWFRDPMVACRFTELFASHGIAPDRLELLGGDLPKASQLAVLNGFDIALDPFPFNGSTTTFEALWMGLPVVSLAGHRSTGRMGADMLQGLGLGELVAGAVEDYVRIAVALARDPERLAALRARLRPLLSASAWCDAVGYARTVEAAYRTLWREWCAGERP